MMAVVGLCPPERKHPLPGAIQPVHKGLNRLSHWSRALLRGQSIQFRNKDRKVSGIIFGIARMRRERCQFKLKWLAQVSHEKRLKSSGDTLTNQISGIIGYILAVPASLFQLFVPDFSLPLIGIYRHFYSILFTVLYSKHEQTMSCRWLTRFHRCGRTKWDPTPVSNTAFQQPTLLLRQSLRTLGTSATCAKTVSPGEYQASRCYSQYYSNLSGVALRTNNLCRAYCTLVNHLVLNNDGCAPDDSPVYEYTPDKDNVVRIVQRPGKVAERQFANATGE